MGVKLQEVVVPKDISIPTKNQTPIALKAGQRVMLIKTPKGVYLRLKDQIVKIKLPNGLMPFGPIPEAGATSGSATGNGSSNGGDGDSPKKFGKWRYGAVVVPPKSKTS